MPPCYAGRGPLKSNCRNIAISLIEELKVRYRDFRPDAFAARLLSLRWRTSPRGASGLFLKDERESKSIRSLADASTPSATDSSLTPARERSSSLAARLTSICPRCLPRRIFLRLDVGHSP